MLSLESSPTLVLNADFQPLSYFPLSLWSWQNAVRAVFMDRVTIVAEYDRRVRSPSFDMALPSVIALKKFIRPSRHPAFTRFNLFLRDSFSCQYCASNDDLTFDHMRPRRLGGQTTWQNVTTACAPCNMRKGGRTCAESAMYPAIAPFRPTTHDLQKRGRAFPPNYLHESWRDYLYWDVALEA